MIYIETERLRLRDWKDSDLDTFCHMNADEEVMKYFPSTLSYAETNTFYYNIIDELKTNSFGLFAVEEKESGSFTGFIGLHYATFEADFTPCVEIGWRLKKEYWGKGYATEGAKACLEYAFSRLDMTEIYSFTAEINQPSKRVMERIGMNFVKTFDHPKVDHASPLEKHVLYHIKKP